MKPVFLSITAILILRSCNGKPSLKKEADGATTRKNITEVFHFQGKQRCITCNAEKLTKEMVDCLATEEVVMKIIDVSKTENEAIADNYEVTWSSFSIKRNGKRENLNKTGFGYAKNQPLIFKSELNDVIHNI